MNRLTLAFFGNTPELTESLFQTSSLETPLTCCRGKDVISGQASGTFQWSRAVSALCSLAVRHASKTSEGGLGAYLSGGRGWNSNCSRCRGAAYVQGFCGGLEECNSCHGHGFIGNCSRCEGTGEVNDFCRGRVMCPTCNGRTYC